MILNKLGIFFSEIFSNLVIYLFDKPWIILVIVCILYVCLEKRPKYLYSFVITIVVILLGIIFYFAVSLNGGKYSIYEIDFKLEDETSLIEIIRAIDNNLSSEIEFFSCDFVHIRWERMSNGRSNVSYFSQCSEVETDVEVVFQDDLMVIYRYDGFGFNVHTSVSNYQFQKLVSNSNVSEVIKSKLENAKYVQVDISSFDTLFKDTKRYSLIECANGHICEDTDITISVENDMKIEFFSYQLLEN